MYLKIVGLVLTLAALFLCLGILVSIGKEGCSECIPYLIMPVLLLTIGAYLLFRKK